MRFFARLIDPGGRVLSQRLGELCLGLEDLTGRLRESIARVIAQTAAEIVRDTVRELWISLVAGSDSLPSTPRSAFASRSRQTDPFEEDEREDSLWGDRQDDSLQDEELDSLPEEESPLEERTALEESPVPSGWSQALAIGCQAMSCWLRRRWGRLSLFSTVGVAVLSTLAAYYAGPVVVVGVRLADSAFSLLQLTAATQRVLASLPGES